MTSYGSHVHSDRSNKGGRKSLYWQMHKTLKQHKWHERGDYMRGNYQVSTIMILLNVEKPVQVAWAWWHGNTQLWEVLLRTLPTQTVKWQSFVSATSDVAQPEAIEYLATWILYQCASLGRITEASIHATVSVCTERKHWRRIEV